MYGDTTVIRALARSLREQGHHVESERDTLVRRVESVPWTGVAADALRTSAHAGAAALARTADLHRVAAADLDRHADEVDRRRQLIAVIEHAVLARIAEARERLHDLASLAGGVGTMLADPVDEFLDHFDPPPSGHKEWLWVQLPFSVPGVTVGLGHTGVEYDGSTPGPVTSAVASAVASSVASSVAAGGSSW